MWHSYCFTELPVHTPRKRPTDVFFYVCFFFNYVIKVRGGFPWVFTSAPANLVSLRGLPSVVRRLPSDLGTYGYANNQAALIHAWSPRNQSPITKLRIEIMRISNTKRQYMWWCNKRLVNCETLTNADKAKERTQRAAPLQKMRHLSTPNRMS